MKLNPTLRPLLRPLALAAVLTAVLALPALAGGPVTINAQPNTLTKGRAACTVGVSVGVSSAPGSALDAVVTNVTSPTLSTVQGGYVVQDPGLNGTPTQISVRVFPGLSTITVRALVRGLPVASADAFYIDC